MEALRQSQKLEAIGQLTGGIAHDFNNMLQGIVGGISLAKSRIDSGPTEDAHKFLEAAAESADRAASLTRRLLAFGRRQALNPKPVVLDTLINGIQDLIQRTVGPAITLNLNLQDECWAVCSDTNQLENALLNLAINARDAMLPYGGQLVIETSHITLQEADTLDWESAIPGDYVCIKVTDTGTGMTPDVLNHAFEPFFTTKADGQGTGLGLSQIYGFVRQSQGIVRLESTVGTGTSIHLYLPRYQNVENNTMESLSPETGSSQRTVTPSAATVLLVDDEISIRLMVATALRERGYKVIEAGDGPTGINALHKALRSKGGKLDILVTDVGLPGGINGRQLADAALEIIPHLPVLLITGYAGDAIEREGKLKAGMDVLNKPFELNALVEKLHTMIDQRRAA